PSRPEGFLSAMSTMAICYLPSGSKQSPGVGSSEGEAEAASSAGAGRKRRWGSSTAVTAKKPSISITTDSLKSLIPDIKPALGQEALLDLHPEEMHLSGEEEGGERGDQDLKIRRTVTQVVPSDTQENGQKESKRSEHENEEERSEGSIQVSMETETNIQLLFFVFSLTPFSFFVSCLVTPSDTLIRRSISQQKSGVSITIDDPVRTAKQPSPPRGKLSNIVHVCNLVRPFTLGQLKELLNRTGTVVEEGFWIDKIKSHCYVTYSGAEEAMATRTALHGVKWPQSNPKFLSVDFCTQEELDFHRGLGPASEKPSEEPRGAVAAGPGRPVPPPLLPERDQWAEREREMERRERTRADREWDRDKVRDFSKPGEERESRSRDRERRRKERGKSKERKTDKKEKGPEDPPAKLLDDLFRKTKAAPCIYWLPLTEEQAAQRAAARAERMREREKRRKEMEEENKKREEERRERMKTSGPTGGEGERDRDRGREREREGDKRKEGYRRPGVNSAGGSRRSRSRSDPPPRERRH
uniref:Apoptotic chromatin condensation inducer in the nucleus-like n=1 Tax=Sinocyclocheilus grahami TaxID=75366 RepID=A0A672L172_SINGR